MKTNKKGKPLKEMIYIPQGATPEEIMDMLEEAGFIPKGWREREKDAKD